MVSGRQHVVAIDDRSQIGEARRLSARLCSEAGLSSNDAGRVAIITTELATNVLLHGIRGQVLLQVLVMASGPVLEITAIDSGPGIQDVDRCLSDGYSTAGTSGTGLGAVRRQADVFDLFSQHGAGTVVFARVGQRDDSTEFAAICVAYPGETTCGDAWALHTDDRGVTILVVDGLGHGPNAAEAAAAALGALEIDPGGAPSAIMALAHQQMSSTRGGSVAVARVELDRSTMRYCAIGNIAGAIVSPEGSRGLFSHNGTVGAQIRAARELDYPIAAGFLLVLHSDGLTTRWQLASYPGMITRHPAVIAGVLFRDFCRGRDDATILVARFPTMGR